MADEEVATAVPRTLTVEERNKPILDIVGDQAAAKTEQADLGGAKFGFTPQQVQAEELRSDEDLYLGDFEKTPSQLALDTPQVTKEVTAPTGEGVARTISAEQLPLTSTQIPAAVNVEGVVSDQSQVDAVSVQDARTKEQLLAAGTLATAQTQELAEKATVQYQLEKIYESLEEGKPLPGWASANVRKVQEIMNKRGLGDSSVAAAAMVQAITESALPIAVQDANKYATIQLANLTNEQQAALSNAATIAAIDARNLDNKMKAAQQNAQSFLSMDMANLSNEQASDILEYQSKVQSLFTEAAAENVRLQFNAKSQVQVDQFYDQLGATVTKGNIDRETATKQFNIDQANSMTKYLAKIQDARDKFNTSMKLQIDQSNTLWRRAINTANTAGQNDENRLNTSALLGMTSTAQNNLWQKYRDEASFVFQNTQNEVQRSHEIAGQVLANQFAAEMFDAKVDASTSAAVGGFFGDVLKNVLNRAAQNLISVPSERAAAAVGGNLPVSN